jgi:hypothetical protein
MIRRSPHTGMFYQHYNIKVWQMIRYVFHGGSGWSWVQSFQYFMDGQGGYNSAKTHYLGESFAARLQSSANTILENAYYDGHSRNFTFERYCETLKGAFTDIELTEEEVLETWKVRFLYR